MPKKTYDELDNNLEDEWYAELAKHGIDSSYESITSPGNSERIWMLFQLWSKEKEHRQRQQQKQR